MIKPITAPELVALVEEQKRVALFGTVQVFADAESFAEVELAAAGYSELCANPALFAVHQLPPDAKAATAALAAACPRVLLVAVVNTTDARSADWLRQTFPRQAAQVPFADVFVAEAGNASLADLAIWEGFRVARMPTILTFKLGHLVDSFVPELPLTHVQQQLAERDAAVRADIEKKKLVNVEEVLRHGGDAGREEWLKRKQEQDWKAAEKERREKEADARRVKARIEEQRKARMGK
jgi:hypothetical protein